MPFRTYIFTLDSLGTRHPQATKQLNKYLKMEALDKLNNSNTSDAIGKAVPVGILSSHVPAAQSCQITGAYST
jgi:hypothetical protein